MGKTRGQIKADIQSNLTDLNINFFSDDDLNQSIQDAYDDIAILTQCIQKNTTINFISNLNYYNPRNLGISDYLGVIAVFNNVSNLWLRDDLSRLDFDRIRRDWEIWIGTPLFWAPSDPQNFIICPKFLASIGVAGAFTSTAFSSAFFLSTPGTTLGSFILYYWACAPTLQSDTDTFLIASDMQRLVTQYATGDLLEQAQEFAKAAEYWGEYSEGVESYADRVKRNTKSDLLLRL